MIQRISTAAARAADQHARWRLDRRIPLTLLGALVLQLIAMVAWATYLEARVASLEVAQQSRQHFGERFARVEERLEGVKEDLVIIRHQLDKIQEKISK